MHLELSTVGNFFRYEAYLIPVGILILVLSLWGREGHAPSTRFWKTAVAGLALAAALSLGWRGAVAHARVPRATSDMYGFNWHIMEFIRKNYDGRTLVINDIGFPGFYTDIRMVDIWGLANIETAKLIYESRLDAVEIERMAKEHGACIAVVLPECLGFHRKPPPGWKKAAEWTIRDRTVVLPTFHFYSVQDAEYPALVRLLREFDRSLPPWVEHVEGTETAPLDVQ